MLQFIKPGFCLLLVAFVFSCSPRKSDPFTSCGSGAWKKLIAFTDIDQPKQKGYSWISASFETIDDSVFYDSKNDLRDRYFIRLDTSSPHSLLYREISKLVKGDSVLFLIEPKIFFSQQFKCGVPAFCRADSAVKVFIRIKEIYSDSSFAVLRNDFLQTEENDIESFFGSAEQKERAFDPAGFYWVEKPQETGTLPCVPGDVLTLSYSGGFLNGRIIDRAESFSFTFGTPDQILRGLNIVIDRLKKGQTTKIILPSQLAFGESGSSNGSVPPCTPMLYKLSIK